MPNDRAHSYQVIKSAINSVIGAVANQDTVVREELGLAPLDFFRIPADDETEEQRAEWRKKEKERITE